jgi:hypothetical protein
MRRKYCEPGRRRSRSGVERCGLGAAVLILWNPKRYSPFAFRSNVLVEKSAESESKASSGEDCDAMKDGTVLFEALFSVVLCAVWAVFVILAGG